ncbi:MAG: cadmium resistance transporter [Candidatus Eiseniibacteriota bacterium]
MTDSLTLLIVGVSAFVATNIDDLFVLMLFFSSSNYHKWQVVIGQYFGIGSLVAVSTLGSLLALIVPNYIIGLLGLVPITIGVIRLVHMRKRNNESEEIKTQVRKWHNHLSILTVAGVTFSNGGDNIGIYTPLFAKYNTGFEVGFIITIFMIMTAIWCVIAYYLVRHPMIASRMKKTGHIVFPLVLIGFGIYIMVTGFL